MSRLDVPYTGDERGLLVGWLDWHRETVHVKCAGLAEEDAWRAPLPSSPLTSAAGLVSHLTAVESYWFEEIVAGLDAPAHWSADDPDLEWRRVPGATLEGNLRRYRHQCAVSRAILERADVGGICAGRRHGDEVSVRWVLLHMIEETARHNGHLDAVRELVDGVVGE
ncbi:DinB family protein [Dactylosporangium sp. NPDC005555]|uniref:DinB family protein n=1 Tax=Dactylosporangium sp. NPDC005555 TaxID=3154889 RepID=UPI0033AB88C0